LAAAKNTESWSTLSGSESDDGMAGARGTLEPRYGSPRRKRRRLRASISFLAPEVWNAGVFFAVTDRLTVGILGQRLVQDRTVGVNGQLIDPNDLSRFVDGFTAREMTTSISFGPAVRYRLVEERGPLPTIHVGAHALEWGTLTSARTEFTEPGVIAPSQTTAAEGDSPDTFRAVYAMFSKRIPWLEKTPGVRSWSVYGGAGFAARTGMRFTAAETGAGDPRIRLARNKLTRETFVGWVGTEVATQWNIAAFGELFTGDECELGWSAGLRWRSPVGITFTLGVTDCLESVGRRSIDLIYLPGGVGSQPSIADTAVGIDGGGSLYPSEEEEKPPRPRRRGGV
jgi:hypothetical protein